MGSVKKKVCVWWNYHHVFHTFLHACHNFINLCFYNADKLKFVCLTSIINPCSFCRNALRFLAINKCQFYIFCLISLTLNWHYPFLAPTCMRARRHQEYLISSLHQVIRILCNLICVFKVEFFRNSGMNYRKEITYLGILCKNFHFWYGSERNTRI